MEKLLAIFLLFTLSPFTWSSPRVALIIGNQDYQHVNSLQSTLSDARAMASTFQKLGFEVMKYENLDKSEMKTALNRFEQRVKGGTGILYFSGHGVQIEGNNYLLPTDIGQIFDSIELKDSAIELHHALNDIHSAQPKFTLAIIDACRNNPFKDFRGNNAKSYGAKSLRSGAKDITVSSGLTEAKPSEGMIIVYAAGINQKAFDRLGRDDNSPNSLFTREFLIELRENPETDVASLVQNVRQRVKDKASAKGKSQTPAVYLQADRFYLVEMPDSGKGEKSAVQFVKDLYGNIYTLDKKWEMLPSSTKRQIGSKENYWAFWTKTIDTFQKPKVRTQLISKNTVKAHVALPKLDGGTHCSMDTIKLGKQGRDWIIKGFTFEEC